VTTEIDDPIARAEEIREKRSRELAQELAPDAVKTLGKLMKGQKLPGDQRATPAVMRQAAMDILTQAHGRPETRDPRVAGGEAAGGGVVVNIIQFGDGRPREIEIGKPVVDAIDRAEQIRELRSRETVVIDADPS
jgi:hypothetical protein